MLTRLFCILVILVALLNVSDAYWWGKGFGYRRGKHYGFGGYGYGYRRRYRGYGYRWDDAPETTPGANDQTYENRRR